VREESREAGGGDRGGIEWMVSEGWIRVRRAGSRSAGVDAGGGREDVVRDVWCAMSGREIAGRMVKAVV
jgi:hypothetical protein